jgi:hypothetical protein
MRLNAPCGMSLLTERLDSGSQRFDKLEKMIWGIYPVMIASLIAIVGLVIAQ